MRPILFLKERIKATYQDEWNWFKKKYRKIFLLILACFVLTVLVSHFYYIHHSEQAQKIAMNIAKIIFKKVSLEEPSIVIFLRIFLNNATVSIFAIIFGLIPFLFLPIWGAFLNGYYLGVLTSLTHIKRLNFFAIFIRLVPHGIFEIPAILYAVSLGIYLTYQVTIVIFDPAREDAEPLFPLLKRYFKSWVGIILPLLLLAAAIEAFITPR